MALSKKRRMNESPAASASLHTTPSSPNSIGRIRPTLLDANPPSTAVSATSKRSQLTPTEKVAVLDWYHAHGRNQKATAKHFQQLPRYNKLNQGTISRWLAIEQKIRAAVDYPLTSLDSNSSRNAATREKSLKHPELEKCMSLWLDNLDATQRIRLSGREIKSVARQIYDELEVPESDRLELSNGWLGRFQTRHGLKLQRRYSEVVVDEEADIEEKRQSIREEVNRFLAGGDEEHSSRCLDDVWSMETTTVFLECSPIKVEGEDGKRTRITVGLAVNATGTDRLEPLFVGHEDTELQGFKYYFSNRVACMTSSVFWAWLQAWNQTLVEENRHVLLLVSQICGKVADITRLSNIQLRFFSHTLAERLQPCSLGLFKAFHTQYRKLVAHRALNKLRSMKENVAKGTSLFEMGYVDAMEVAKTAWQLVGLGTKLPASCWRHAQILPPVGDNPDVALFEAGAYVTIAINEEIVALEQALQGLTLEARSHQLSMSCMGANEFVHLGLDEGKCNDLSIKELVQLVVGQDKDQERNFAKETSSPTPEHTPSEDNHFANPDNDSSMDIDAPSSPPSIDVSPEVVLHAQLTLEQYWTQNNFDLSPAVLQVLEQTRAQLLQQHQQQQAATISSTTSTPP